MFILINSDFVNINTCILLQHGEHLYVHFKKVEVFFGVVVIVVFCCFWGEVLLFLLLLYIVCLFGVVVVGFFVGFFVGFWG